MAVVASSSSMSPVAELVGDFDHGLEGGRWSPDGEVLALFTYVDDEYDDNESTTMTAMKTKYRMMGRSAAQFYGPYGRGGGYGCG